MSDFPAPTPQRPAPAADGASLPLAGGGAASTRNDPLGKAMGQMLLGMPVRVPVSIAQQCG